MVKYFRIWFRFRGDIHKCKKLWSVIDIEELTCIVVITAAESDTQILYIMLSRFPHYGHCTVYSTYRKTPKQPANA